MSLIINRKEDDNTIIYTYKYYAIMNYILFILIVLMIWKIYPFFIAVLIYSIVLLLDTWKTSKELRKAMKEDRVEVRGSRWSVKNPLTATIRKD